MDLHSIANSGDKVTVTKDSLESGYQWDSEKAKAFLTPGHIYTVEIAWEHDLYITVVLEEFPDEYFNGYVFVEYKQDEPAKIIGKIGTNLIWTCKKGFYHKYFLESSGILCCEHENSSCNYDFLDKKELPEIKDKLIIKAVEQLEYFENVKYRMKEEGFDYCFDGYSDWKEIKDKHFHKLRNNYLNAMKELKEYVNKKSKE